MPIFSDFVGRIDAFFFFLRYNDRYMYFHSSVPYCSALRMANTIFIGHFYVVYIVTK